jgi:putative PIN family toxin of toxin-antitoxin system
VKILLDTNLLVRAAITPEGSAREILRLIEANETHVLILSPYLLSEIADVLRRDRIRARWPLSHEEIRLYCQYLARIGEEVLVEPLPPVIEDPKIQAIIETAVAGAAAVICTFDAFLQTARSPILCRAWNSGDEGRRPSLGPPKREKKLGEVPY